MTSSEQKVVELVKATIEEANKPKSKFKDVDVVRQGAQIILPEKMTTREGIEWLQRKLENEEKIVAVNEVIDCHPLEGAYAFIEAIKDKFGFTTLADTPSFFGPRPPTMIAVEIDVNKREQIPWGRVQIPGWEDGFVEPGYDLHESKLVFCIRGQVKRKYLDGVKELGELTRKRIAEKSIYRGRAVRASFPVSDDVNDFNLNDCPKFMDLGDVKLSELIFPDKTRLDVETSILTPIRHTDACRAAGIPRKRGILMEGPYGVGKTLTANVTAKTAVENGWTFVYLNDVKELPNAIHFAKQYQPAVIFAEDIDRVSEDKDGTDHRDETVKQIADTIDGIDTKSIEVMVVVTTNHVERINKTLLRPGRFDAVISVRAPDAAAVQQLVRLYGRGLIAEKAKLHVVGEKLNGQIPAVIREVVERSKLAAINARGRADNIEASDLEIAADSMLTHLELMRADDPKVPTPTETMLSMIAEAAATTTSRKLTENGFAEKIAEKVAAEA